MRRAVLLLLVLGACSGLRREARIERRLEAAGLKPARAACLARRLDRDLSDDELRALAKAVRRPDGGGRLRLGDLAAQVATLDDPHIADVLARAGLGCALLG